MDKQDIEQMPQISTFEEVAAVFSANGTEITKPLMRLMSPHLSGRQTLDEHRSFLKAQLSEMKE